MANEQNLIPLNKRAKSLQREIQSKGGKAKAEKEREKKIFKELTEVVLSTENRDKQLIEIAKSFGIEDPDNKMLVVLGLTRAAINGNTKAFDILYELTGEKTQLNDIDTINENMITLAELINNPVSNRNIEDFEE